MDLAQYVKENQQVADFVKSATPGVIDKYVGTLDYATARFNTILLKLSQDALLADQYRSDVEECFQVIQSFYKNTQRYVTSPYPLKPIFVFVLYVIGMIKIPKIKFLLEKINN